MADKTQTITVLNGPNLNMLGVREPEKYGASTLKDVEAMCDAAAAELGFNCVCKQTNFEGELVTWIQDARETSAAIVINAAAYTHTSVAVFDALSMFEGPVMEVHISDIHAREKFRHHSYVALRADDEFVGQGVKGYVNAIARAAELIAKNG